jgi:CHRD domain/PEP-CTERM motif
MFKTQSFKAISVIFAAMAVLTGSLPTANATPILYQTTLLGSNEVPPTGSPATGVANVTLNGDLLTVDETFSGLVGGAAAAAHIHCCAAPGINAIVAVPFTGFPAATSGSYLQTFDLTLQATYTSAFITSSGGNAAAAEAALINALDAGLTYANIHDASFPGGEIRGQLQRVPEAGSPVPEPGSLFLLLSGLAGFAVYRRRAHF